MVLDFFFLFVEIPVGKLVCVTFCGFLTFVTDKIVIDVNQFKF